MRNDRDTTDPCMAVRATTFREPSKPSSPPMPIPPKLIRQPAFQSSFTLPTTEPIRPTPPLFPLIFQCRRFGDDRGRSTGAGTITSAADCTQRQLQRVGGIKLKRESGGLSGSVCVVRASSSACAPGPNSGKAESVPAAGADRCRRRAARRPPRQRIRNTIAPVRNVAPKSLEREHG